MALQRYLDDTAALLHDQNYLFTSKSQLVTWINEARRQIAQRTGCIRRLVSGQSAFGASAQPGIAVPGGMQPGALPDALPAGGGVGGFGSGDPWSSDWNPAFGPPPGSQQNNIGAGNAAVNLCQTIPGQERYPFQGFFNPFLQAQYAGCKAIIDVNNCAVNWGGAVRPSLAWMAFEDLQAYARAYATLVTSYPYYWSVMNDGEFGEIWLFPAPSTPGDIELDAYCVPLDLYAESDFEALPPGVTNAVKYGAAALAYMTSKRYIDAGIMGQMFTERLGNFRVSADRGKVPNYYFEVI
jgi:hypothetical protein